MVEEVVVMVAIMAELFGWRRLWRCGHHDGHDGDGRVVVKQS